MSRSGPQARGLVSTGYWRNSPSARAGTFPSHPPRRPAPGPVLGIQGDNERVGSLCLDQWSEQLKLVPTSVCPRRPEQEGQWGQEVGCPLGLIPWAVGPVLPAPTPPSQAAARACQPLPVPAGGGQAGTPVSLTDPPLNPGSPSGQRGRDRIWGRRCPPTLTVSHWLPACSLPLVFRH